LCGNPRPLIPNSKAMTSVVYMIFFSESEREIDFLPSLFSNNELFPYQVPGLKKHELIDYDIFIKEENLSVKFWKCFFSVRFSFLVILINLK
jgi:hypothetical protein